MILIHSFLGVLNKSLQIKNIYILSKIVAIVAEELFQLN